MTEHMVKEYLNISAIFRFVAHLD